MCIYPNSAKIIAQHLFDINIEDCEDILNQIFNFIPSVCSVEDVELISKHNSKYYYLTYNKKTEIKKAETYLEAKFSNKKILLKSKM